MKLTYRGVSYEYNPPTVEVSEGQVAGKFRGLDWRFRNLKKAPVLQPPVNLTYRGVKYCNHPTFDSETIETQPIAEPALSVSQQTRLLMIERDRAARKRQQSMLSRLSHEIGLGVNAPESYNHA